LIQRTNSTIINLTILSYQVINKTLRLRKNYCVTKKMSNLWNHLFNFWIIKGLKSLKMRTNPAIDIYYSKKKMMAAPREILIMQQIAKRVK